ncbi:UNVERIFIED_CONTAM: hypothetical protein FKN15_064891 [Acipenser sinensis]
MLVRSVFTDLRTRRLGTRGSARYHYDGISVKKRSPLYARYCFLMKLNSIDRLVDNFYTCEGYSIPRCLMYDFYLEACSRLEQNQVNAATFGKLVRSVFTDLRTRRLGTRGSARYHYDGISVKKRSPLYARYCFLMKLNSIDSLTFLNKEKHGSYIPTKNSEDQFTFIADEYHNYCQDILQNVRNKELDKVQDVVIFFWKSLPISVIELMSLPDVSQFFSSYDAQLYKMIEGILINDFLEEVSVQDLKKARMFSKNFRSWLLTVLDDFPIMLQASKRKEAIVFVNRLRRKSCLCNLVKTMKSVINDSQIISTLKSDLHSILTHGILNIPRKSLEKDLWESEEENSNTEIKCTMIEGILINDFLEEVSVQDLKKARMFSKNFRSWLLTVLDDFPIMLQASKRKEAIVFVNRLRRKSCLCNLVKTMKSVINDSQIISTLKSDLHSILTHGILNIPRKSLEKDLWESEEENSNTEIKCTVASCLF